MSPAGLFDKKNYSHILFCKAQEQTQFGKWELVKENMVNETRSINVLAPRNQQ